MLKNAVVLFSLSFFFLCDSARAELVSFSSVPFRYVDYRIDAFKARIWFKSAVIGGLEKDIEVKVEAVDVVLKEEKVICTTLDLIDVNKNVLDSIWLTPEKVVITVRHKNDLLRWRKFLLLIKKKQEQERKKLVEPIRVLPPEKVD
jgi:hypothetical protein